ncbi:hypothetical protein [Pyrobaculum aerophilum]|uniref:hypothetical protein n=2 Tax=Pyrobaculum TaxID=2276 RepID=UPI002FD888AB
MLLMPEPSPHPFVNVAYAVLSFASYGLRHMSIPLRVHALPYASLMPAATAAGLGHLAASIAAFAP